MHGQKSKSVVTSHTSVSLICFKYVFAVLPFSAQLNSYYYFSGPTKHRKGLKHRKGPQIDVLNTAKGPGADPGGGGMHPYPPAIFSNALDK